MRTTEERRAGLRDTLVTLAEAQITQGGAASLKARDLAGQAGCAVGAIYNVFADMNALVMAVNGRTFRRIGQAVTGAVAGQDEAPPERRLVVLSLAYLDFADANHNLWRALFDIDLPDTAEVPDWYRAELAALFAIIARPVSQLFPHLAGRELELMVRALFSSVHGMVLLGLQNRISGVPRANIRAMIEMVLLRLATGRDVTL